jgi:hypothetical protein
MLGTRLKIILFGLISFFFYSCSLFFNSGTFEKLDKIDEILFYVLEEGNKVSVTVNLKTNGSSKKLMNDGYVSINRHVLASEFYNGLSSGYQYVGTIKNSKIYELEISHDSQVIFKRLYPKMIKTTIPDEIVMDNNPVEVLLEGEINEGRASQISIFSIDNLPLFKDDKYQHRSRILNSSELNGKITINKDQLKNLSHPYIKLSIGKSFPQPDGTFSVLFTKKVFIRD